jgi:transposase
MVYTDWLAERKAAIHLLRSGLGLTEVARRMKRSVGWVAKWRDRYEEEGWAGLEDRSHAPKNPWQTHPEPVRQAIRQARSELEAEAYADHGLHYVGPPAVQARLREKRERGEYEGPLPSTATIERVLRAAHMVRPWQKKAEAEVHYPHLRPTAPQQLVQVDIVPHYLRGGQAVACFNAIDVVSRYPTGQAKTRRRSQDACEFLIHTWQTLGIPRYTQVDNEGCFSGGFTHRGVLGKVLRLALHVGTELVFSPFYHPASNGFVERFHQDYDDHVWEHTELQSVADVQQQADAFFSDYRHSGHHSALQGQSPATVHSQVKAALLVADFSCPKKKLPLTEGRVHFMRRVGQEGTVKVCNIEWQVPEPEDTPTVWVTLEFAVTGAVLSIYDAAPDAQQRVRLAAYDFPLKEPVLPRQALIHLAPLTPDHDGSTCADQSARASATEPSVTAQLSLTDCAPTPEKQIPASAALVTATKTRPVADPLVQSLPPPSLPLVLLLGIVHSAVIWTRRARFTIL